MPAPVSKVGLVVEGGAMRGIISMAYLSELERSGLRHAFPCVFAESAGAVNSAYFLAGQSQAGLSQYHRIVNRRSLVQPRRIWNMLDLDSAFSTIAAGDLSLHCEALRQSPGKLHVSLTRTCDGTPVSLPLEGPDQRILSVLKATSAIVPYYNRPVLIDGQGFVDGGIADPVPVLRAIQAGCTHLLVLLTRPANYLPGRLRPWERLLTRLLLTRWGPEFRTTFFRHRPQRYNRSRSLAFGIVRPPPGVHIAAVCPEGLGRVDRFCRDAGFLNWVAQRCVTQMRTLLETRSSRLTHPGVDLDFDHGENRIHQLIDGPPRIGQVL